MAAQTSVGVFGRAVVKTTLVQDQNFSRMSTKRFNRSQDWVQMRETEKKESSKTTYLCVQNLCEVRDSISSIILR